MTRIAAWIERHWHGPHTRKRNAENHRPTTNFGHQCMTTRRKP